MKDNHEKKDEIWEKMKLPKVEISEHQRVFNLTLLNTKRSALAGVVLLVLPFFFLTGVLIRHYLGLDFALLTGVYEWISEFDNRHGDSSVLNWIIRLLLVFGPLIAVTLNLLSVAHVRYERQSREVVLAFKLRWLNWTIIGLCLAIFMVFSLYFIVENAAP